MTLMSKLMRFSGELCNEGMNETLVIESDWVWLRLELESAPLRKYDSNIPDSYDRGFTIFSFGPDIIVKRKT